MKILGKVNSVLKLAGFQLGHVTTQREDDKNTFILTESYKIRQQLINFYGITKILDVGANTGQFATVMRNIGFKGNIVSFEPLSSAYTLLSTKAKTDDNWECMNIALGEKEGASTIHIAGNSYSSSILDMLVEHEAYDPNSRYVGTETISVKTLDSLYNEICSLTDSVYIKIDTQGFEKQVILGADKSLHFVTIIQVELSLRQLYKNEPLFDEVYKMLLKRGFEILTFENGITDAESGRLLQVDVIFINKKVEYDS